MADAVRICVWCEDREHERFARELLAQLGVDRRRVRFQVAPSGRGSGSQWVVMQYATVCRQARAKRNQSNLGFLVVVDGDSDGRVQVAARLDAEAKRADDDRVAHWIPTWSIETWVLWLAGEDVTESVSFKHSCDFTALLRKAVAAWERPRSRESSDVPSLEAARSELERLPLK